MKAPLLELENINKRFGDRILFNIERLVVEQGHCTLITGDNGSGKTTLLKIIAGLLKPDHCRVLLRDAGLPWAKARTRIRELVVYLHQDPYMFDTSVERNVAYGLRVGKEPTEQLYEKVAAALRWARLDHLAHRNARSLSGGEKQRVALTRARILNRPVLLLDEPTANMDQQSRINTYQLIDVLRNEGIAVVVASHDRTGLAPVADNHVQLISGKLIEVEPAVRRTRKSRVTRFPR